MEGAVRLAGQPTARVLNTELSSLNVPGTQGICMALSKMVFLCVILYGIFANMSEALWG